MSKVLNEALQASDKAHFLHPFSDFKEMSQNGTRLVSQAEDVYIY